MCLGNACRSQMAEGFARAYGSDVVVAVSAGVAPAVSVPAETRRAMAEKNIDISEQFPKSLSLFPRGHFDLVVNMSGCPLAGFDAVREWRVIDPYGSSEKTYRAVRDQIEQLVMSLIIELRRKK
ncbi:MAG: hypothetical protein ACRD96_10815 [Bryobacteraceae bacterium]